MENPHVFPHPSGAQGCEGMTLRDWFAGQALSGLCANPEMAASNEHEFAQAALRVADALLAQRESERG